MTNKTRTFPEMSKLKAIKIEKLRRSKRQELIQTMVKRVFSDCWACGRKIGDYHHTPPRCMTPKMWIKIPVCKKCHRKFNTGEDYTMKEKRSLRSNIRRIEKSVKNVRRKLLDN